MKSERSGYRVNGRAIIAVLLLCVILELVTGGRQTGAQEDAITFDIAGFAVNGSSVIEPAEIERILKPFTGKEKTTTDVEKARETLEAHFHKRGYPTVLVNIPEQSVESGEVRLEVIESKIRRVRVRGNRYFTHSQVLKNLPSFRPGGILYLPDVQRELSQANRNPDMSVTPVMSPGNALGTIDVELKVDDKLPLHGSLEVNNHATVNTKPLRLNASLSYDNLWMREHQLSLQYQVSPQDASEVQVVAGSYVLPSPLDGDQRIAVYGILSDSESAFGDGFQTIGKGFIFGGRYVVPLPSRGTYAHNMTLGADYKDFDQDVGRIDEGGEPVTTPISYVPFTVSYGSYLSDTSGLTQFSAGVNFCFRGLFQANPDEFDAKRIAARGNYLYVTAGVERNQKLPAGMKLFAKFDGQVATEPLVSNEQYIAGGATSVRGYYQGESAGDHAVHATVELIGPDLFDLAGVLQKADLEPLVFYDGATLMLLAPSAGEDRHIILQGIGTGVKGVFGRNISYSVDFGVALNDTDTTKAGSTRGYFKVKMAF